MHIRKLAIAVILLSAVGGGWFAWRWYTTPVAPEISLDGVDEVMAETVKDAIDAVRRQPRSGSAWGELGMVLAANGFEVDAPRCFVEAQRLDPTNAAWPYLDGVLRLEVEPKRAIPLLRKALALTSDRSEQAAIHFRITLALVEDGKLAEAEKHLEEVRQLDPEGARVKFVLALLALARDDRDAARKHLASLTTNPFIQKRASTLLAGLVDKEEARDLMDRAARMPIDFSWPDPIEQQMRSGYVDRMKRIAPYEALFKQGRQKEAIQFLRRLVAQAPDAESVFTLGHALYRVDELEEAEKVFRVAIRYEPTNVMSHFLIASSLMLRGEKMYQDPRSKEASLDCFRQAVAAADQALALKSEMAVAHQTRGWSLKYLGRTDEALKALRQAVLIQPDSAEMHMQLGEALAEAGQKKEAVEHLRYAVQFAHPSDPRPAQALKKWQEKTKDR